MSAWLYRKPEATHIRGLCVKCDKNLQKKTSAGTYQAMCCTCERERFNMLKRYKSKWKNAYSKHKRMICNRCGFEAKDRCQLDVHHKDRNHHNNDPNNLETLCANCHRLEHKKTPTELPAGVL